MQETRVLVETRGTTGEETISYWFELPIDVDEFEEKLASLCLYIAFILISAVGTILAVQSLSDAAKYKYRYLTLRRLGVNNETLFKTIRKQLIILFGVPVVYSVIASFCMAFSVNNVYQILLTSRFIYLIYFAGSLAILFLLYGIYWIATYIGCIGRNVTLHNRLLI